MTYELQRIQMGPGVELWKPSADVLHDPAVQSQEPPAEAVFLGLPLGECGGVRMANEAIERISTTTGRPVFGNHEPTHGADATARFRAAGATFGLAPGVIPLNSPYVISAHGADPRVAREARDRGLIVFDITCPLVERTHVAIRRAAAEAERTERPGHVAYISFGSREHAELVGAAGAAADLGIAFTAVSNETDVDEFVAGLDEGTTVTIVGQTTNNSDEADALARHLSARAAERDDIAVAREKLHDVCHTVRDRQDSARELVAAHNIGTLVVVGSVDSKNTKSLAEVAARQAIAQGVALVIRLVNSWAQLPVVEGRVGVISGASTLTENVEGVVARLLAKDVKGAVARQAPVEGLTYVGTDTDRGITFIPVDDRTKALFPDLTRGHTTS